MPNGEIMIKNLFIENFRGFEHFELKNLGRINLLVGTNNCGKTSILEAVELNAAKGDASAILRISMRRGELVESFIDSNHRSRFNTEVDIKHLFHGHTINSELKIEADTNTTPIREVFMASVIDIKDAKEWLEKKHGKSIAEVPYRNLRITWNEQPELVQLFPLSEQGGVGDSSRGRLLSDEIGTCPVRFISTSGLTTDEVINMFDSVSLGPEEDHALEALRTIDPSIERVATVLSSRRTKPGVRGGIKVKCQGNDHPIPIGSMGDGMWRMLGLSLAIASAENGILLIDEIDTGLHFTVMEDMWRLLDEASQRLNVQVFATTHSRDAYESLAAISKSTDSNDCNVTIQRIDSSKSESVVFSEQEIVAAAERGIEVR